MNSINSTLKSAYGQKPVNVESASASYLYYYSYLLNMVKGRFNVSCPLEWDVDYILDALLLKGVFCVTDTALGVLPLKCEPFGINVFDRATKVNITNNVLGSFERTIGEDCEIVYLYDTIFFHSIIPLLHIYAQRLATCDCSVDVNLINSRVSDIFECADGAQVATAKKMYDEISQGKPAVFIRKANSALDQTGIERYSNSVKNSFIADTILDVKRTIVCEFLTAIGINNANTDKKERLNSDEVNSNNAELETNIAYIRGNLGKSCKKVNAMFGDILHIDIRETNNNDDFRYVRDMADKDGE